jgi:hypothetical protein
VDTTDNCFEVKTALFIDLVAKLPSEEDGDDEVLFYYQPEMVQLRLLTAIQQGQTPGSFISSVLLSSRTEDASASLSPEESSALTTGKNAVANRFYVWVALMVHIVVTVVFVRYLAVFYHCSDLPEHQSKTRPLFYPQHKQYRCWVGSSSSKPVPPGEGAGKKVRQSKPNHTSAYQESEKMGGIMYM